ncbi:MAG: hypothetical protein NC114_06400 [Ruminococcus flavefaciens]|nr:hypothetical protein [Ruminococcus flavefaciens]
MIHTEKLEYYIFNESTVREETNEKYTKILRENVTDVNGHRIFTITFKQVLSEEGVGNWNGRTYPTGIWMKAVQSNPLIQHDLKHDVWMAEYGHPDVSKSQNELARQMTIFPPNVCWKISNPHMEGNLWIGECTTTPGGYGDILRDRALVGITPMASTRAIGGCDARGNVLPGINLVTVDSVVRQSSKGAYADMSTLKVNEFNIPAGNTMQESVSRIDMQSESFKSFLLTESVSRDKIARVCDTMNLDYDSMVLTENSIKISRIDETTKITVVLPLRKLIGANQYHLFD